MSGQWWRWKAFDTIGTLARDPHVTMARFMFATAGIVVIVIALVAPAVVLVATH